MPRQLPGCQVSRRCLGFQNSCRARGCQGACARTAQLERAASEGHVLALSKARQALQPQQHVSEGGAGKGVEPRAVLH